MTTRFDPNFTTFMEGEFLGGVTVSEPGGVLGPGNLVIDPTKPFEITATWHVFGHLVPIWLAALKSASPSWVVSAYAESVGPGPEKMVATTNVPIGVVTGSHDVTFSATLTVPAGTLAEENPGNPNVSGLYKIVLTTFLNSPFGLPGYDVMGYAEGPIIKVENPV
ncbi:MAG: hypothetical protein R2705_18145 [Ilumatobacteraceae bacterium]